MGEYRNDLRATAERLKQAGDNDTEIAVSRPLHDRAVAFFNRHFGWQPGEYEVTLEIRAVPERASVSRAYRFMLFESDTTRKMESLNDYRYGQGMIFDPPDPSNVNVFVELKTERATR